MQNPSRKYLLYVGVLFKEIAEINSTALVSQGGLPVNILELSALLQEDLT